MIKYLQIILCTVAATFGWQGLSAQESKSIHWHTNYDEAVQVAKDSSKPLLLLFTGSDWCSWCIKLEKEVLSTPEFAERVADKFVFVKLDFPTNSKLPPQLATQYKQLQKQFSVSGFPSIVLLDAKQQKSMGSVGYRPGGGKAYADHLLSMIGSHHAYLDQIQNLDKQPPQGAVLKELYAEALELKRSGDADQIVMLGMKSDEKLFFMLERYKSLAEEGQLASQEAMELQQALLNADPNNELLTHYKVAIIAFETLNRGTSLSTSEQAVETLLKYIERFGATDKENLWRLELIIAQVYYEQNKIPEALQFALSSYQVAPPSARAEINTTIQNMGLELPK